MNTEIILFAFDSVGLVVIGFFLGRIYEKEHGLYRRKYKQAMEGWAGALGLATSILVESMSVDKTDKDREVPVPIVRKDKKTRNGRK